MQLLTVDIRKAGYLQNDKSIIQDIAFSLKKGELIGLIGPNGAGKSTTIKAILGLLPQMEGEVRLIGNQTKYAYIPEQPIFYDKLTLWEHLEFAAAVYKIERDELLRKGGELLKIFNLHDVKNHYPTSFSKGMQQKIMLTVGFLIQPDIYIIDEPFVGLDPRTAKEFINMLEVERSRGAGILISTHQLDIAEKICRFILIMADGNLVARGNLMEIRESCRLPHGSLFECFYTILENQ